MPVPDIGKPRSNGIDRYHKQDTNNTIANPTSVRALLDTFQKPVNTGENPLSLFIWSRIVARMSIDEEQRDDGG